MDLSLRIAELQVLSENFIKKTGKNLADNEFKVMVLLRVFNECTPSVLISKMGILKTNLALLLKKLIDGGLVCFRKSSLDSRSKMYSLTDLGNQVMDQILADIDVNLEGAFTEDFALALEIVPSVLNKRI